MIPINFVNSNDDEINRKLSFTVCFQISIVGIKNILVQGIPQLYAINNSLNLLLLGIVLIKYSLVFVDGFYRFTKLRAFPLLIALTIVITLGGSLLISSKNASVMAEWLPRTIPYCFITFFLISKLTSFRWIVYYMTKFSYFIILATVIAAIWIRRIGHVTTGPTSYSMPLSYSALIGVIWLLYKYFRQGKIIDLALSILGSIIIVLYGSRNPLLAIGSFIIVNLFRSMKKKEVSTNRKIVLSLVIVAIVLSLLFYNNILTYLSHLLQQFGLSSRTIGYLTSSDIDFSSGRAEIHKTIYSALTEHLFFGLGAGGDVAFTGNQAHGLYISILSTYGYILGSVILALLGILIVKAYIKSSGNDRDILLLYLCLVIPRGFTGGDIWESDIFWWLLGICICLTNKEFITSSEQKFYSEIGLLVLGNEKN